MQNANNMYIKSLITMIIACCCSVGSHAQIHFNGDVETLDEDGRAAGWDYTFNGRSTFPVNVDSVEKKSGQYALSIAYDGSEGADKSGAFSYAINETLAGSYLILTVWIKTEDVEGFVGPWIRVDGVEQKFIAFDFLENQISGTTDWTQYFVRVPYDRTKAVAVLLGGSLVGTGKAWLDDFQLYLDDAPITEATVIPKPNYPALRDSTYLQHSGIDTIVYTDYLARYLPLLGEVWGFVKYHHPAIARGEVNWDGELFRILPEVLTCQNDAQFSAILLGWIDKLSAIRQTKEVYVPEDTSTIALWPDYGTLFCNDVFSEPLVNRLAEIRDHGPDSAHHHIRYEPHVVQHESAYLHMSHPDAGYRLLSVLRYYSIIQYCSPNRNLISAGWTTLLPGFIHDAIHCVDQSAYANTMARMISAIRDTHGFMHGQQFEATLGSHRVPFKAQFIQDELVVTGYYKDTLAVRQQLQVGDIITAINGLPVDTLYTRFRPLVPASNEAAVKRDIVGKYLLRTDSTVFHLDILRGGKPVKVSQQAVENGAIDFFGGDWNPLPDEPGFKLLDSETGYIYCKHFKQTDLPAIKEAFKDTKGIIIDMRNYPTDDLIDGLEGYLLAEPLPFVKFTTGSVKRPGLFRYTPLVYQGKINENAYQGKVVVLVNEMTQSNAEFVTMFLQSIPGTVVIGSQTAGADGNISNIPLLGGMSTEISGIGVHYPDGTNAQGVGVKIDEVTEPTIDGIINGTDEVLLRARQLISVQKSK